VNTLERLEDRALFEERLSPIVANQNFKGIDLLASDLVERHKAIRTGFAGIFDVVGHMSTPDNRTLYTPRINLPPTVRRASQMSVELSTPINLGAAASTFSTVQMEFFNRGKPFVREEYRPSPFVEKVASGQNYSALALSRQRPGVSPFEGMAVELRAFESVIVGTEERLDLVHSALGKTGLIR
jgi:hypothetical protein